MIPISLGAAIAGVGVTCSAYALLLSTQVGQRWTTAKTWTTVVFGVALVLAWLAAYDLNAALVALAFFCVGGTPLIIRSLWLEYRQQEAVNHQDNP